MAAEPLGPPLNIDKFLGKSKNRLNLIGVELEGGWNTIKGDLRPMRDGSIHFGIPGDDEYKVSLIKHVGEIPLPPLGLREFPSVMRLYYPSYVNATCGMHVHLSTLKAFAYQRLMINQPYSYPGTVVEYMKRWAKKEGLSQKHPIWPRLLGQNEYCQHVFHADEQAKTANKDYDHHRQGHRYTVISYCWSRYKTLECRLLPMMDNADQGILAVQAIADITNAFLAASREKEPRIRARVTEADDAFIEERRSFV